MHGIFETSEDLVTTHIAWISAQLRDDALAEVSRTTLARVQATRRAGIELPILRLQQRLALSETEMRVIWLLLAHELDPAVRAALRAVASEQLADVTLDAIRRVVYGNVTRPRAWHELATDAPLRTLGLIERSDGNAPAPEYRQTFKIAQRVLALAYGDLALDAEVASFARVVAPSVLASSLQLAPGVLERAQEAIAGHGTVIAHGRVGSGRRSLLTAVVAKPTLVVDARALSAERAIARVQLRMAARECKLLGAVPLISAIESLGAGPDRIDLVESELDGLVLATSTSRVARRWMRPVVQIELAPLGGAACATLWKQALPQASDTDANYLASTYPLTP